MADPRRTENSDSSLCLSNPKVITDMSNTNPMVVTAVLHGFSNGDSVILKDLVDPKSLDLDPDKKNMSSLNENIFTAINITANTFELEENAITLDGTEFNEYGSGGNVWKRVTSISGLGHLESREVQVKGDGGIQSPQIVVDGKIELDFPAGEVVIGLKYKTTIITLPKDFDSGIGSMLAQPVRWVRPFLRVNNSYPPLVNGEFIPSRTTQDLLGNKVPLITGYLDYGSLESNDAVDGTSSLTITIDDPFPLELTGITGSTQSGER